MASIKAVRPDLNRGLPACIFIISGVKSTFCFLRCYFLQPDITDLISIGLFVCFITRSFLTYSFILPTLTLSTICRPCQATCVQSHQRQPTSAVAITTCEVQVSAADSQTVPTVATGVSKPLYCRLTLTFTLTNENLSLYITLLLYWSLYNYAAHAADILTPTTVVQGVDNHS